MQSVLSLAPSYYEALKRLTLELAGVNLNDNHAFLVETRLTKLARKEGFETLERMVNELFSKGNSRLAIQVVSSLTERDTHFFRDPEAFAHLRNTVIPQLQKTYSDERLRLLSFGCSSGQEPYAMAMTTTQMETQFPELKIEIIGVDYPSQALERARAGRYTHFEVQRGLPIQNLVKFFTPDGEDWIVKANIKDKVKFHDIHLLSKLETLPTHHAVMFCGALPHYSAPARVRVLRGLSQLICENGFLVLGKDENLSGMNFGFDKVKSGLYKKREALPVPVETEEAPPKRVRFGPETKLRPRARNKF